MGRISHLALVGIGGALGATIRWAIAELWTVTDFPWATLVINVLGCALLGRLSSADRSTETARFLGGGFCGGLTTFSTLSVEVVTLLDRGDSATAAVYLGASVVLGVAAYVASRTLVASPIGDHE